MISSLSKWLFYLRRHVLWHISFIKYIFSCQNPTFCDVSLTWIQSRVDPRWFWLPGSGSLPYWDKKLDPEPQHLLCLCRNAPTARRSTTICATLSAFCDVKVWPGSRSTWIRYGLALWILIRIEIQRRIRIRNRNQCVSATLVVPMQECPYCQKEYNNLRDHISFLWRQSLTWIQIRVDPRWFWLPGSGSLPYWDKKLDPEPQHLLCPCRNAPTARRSTTTCATISGLVTPSLPGGDSALSAPSQAATPRRFQISGVISGTVPVFFFVLKCFVSASVWIRTDLLLLQKGIFSLILITNFSKMLFSYLATCVLV